MSLSLFMFLAAAGAALVCLGITLGGYPLKGRFIKRRRRLSLEVLAGSGLIKHLLSPFIRSGSGRYCRFCGKVLAKAESTLAIRSLFLLKFLSLICALSIMLLVNQTNVSFSKASAIARFAAGPTGFLQPPGKAGFKYNMALYEAIIKKIGRRALNKPGGPEQQAEEVRKALPGLVGSDDGQQPVDDTADAFVKTYRFVEGMHVVDFPFFLILLGSFWIPEAVLIARRCLLNGLYRKEAVKLESIFELLAGIRDFKTIDILGEMKRSSKVYGRHLERCIESYRTERELALENLRQSVRNGRFAGLVDVLRIYALVDKGLAVQILERSRLEKEEGALMTADEDLDLVDVAAFASIAPVLYELANLLMKPMLDMIYEAFKFI